MKEVYLKCDMLPYEKSSVNKLIDRLYTIAKSNYGVLSGNVIYIELFNRCLGVEAEKEILEAFGIHDLKSKIYGISDIGLHQDVESMCVYLVFEIEDEVQKEFSTDCVTKDISDIYAYINEINTKTLMKASIEITTVRATVNFSKDDSVAHDIVTNMFDNVSAVFKDLNAIKSETGVELEVYMTAVGIHFESSKNNLVFSISVTKSDLDNVTDVATPIQKTIDIAIKKVID
jgi:hypothetical protein